MEVCVAITDKMVENMKITYFSMFLFQIWLNPEM